MMNLEVLFRAYDLGGDTNFYNFAYSHAEKTMLNHVRPDGSTYHIVEYDGNTGAVLWRGTFAGASDESTWARGQSWGVYGFTMAYRETGDTRFLNTAQRLADYCLTNLPPDYVPYWDYQAPGIPNEPRDSSAAAILLSGLLELSQRSTNAPDAARYWQAARHIFNSLRSTNYLAQGSISSGKPPSKTTPPPSRFPIVTPGRLPMMKRDCFIMAGVTTIRNWGGSSSPTHLYPIRKIRKALTAIRIAEIIHSMPRIRQDTRLLIPAVVILAAVILAAVGADIILLEIMVTVIPGLTKMAIFLPLGHGIASR